MAKTRTVNRRTTTPPFSEHDLAELRQEYRPLVADLAAGYDDLEPARNASDAVLNVILSQFLVRAAILRKQQSISDWVAEQYKLDDEGSETGYTTLNGY